jgi:hypothetical protein
MPHTAVEVERENCVVRTPMMLAWLNTIERLPDQLHAHLFVDLYIAREPRIQGDCGWRVKGIPPHSRRAVSCRIAVVVEIEIHLRRIWLARLRGQNAAELPALKNGPRSRWQVVCVAYLRDTNQRLGNVGVGCPGSATCYFNIWMATREKLRQAEDEKGSKRE